MIRIELPDFSLKVPRWELVNLRKYIRGNLHNRGIYVLYADDWTPLYVEKSRKIYERLQLHIRGGDVTKEFYSDIAFIGIIHIPEVSHLDIYETHAINTIRPIHNRDKVFYTSETVKMYEFELTMVEGEKERYRDLIEDLEGEAQVSSFARQDYEDAREGLRKINARITYLNGKLNDCNR